ncbi:hypothetical protein QBC34DRAFT_426902 [Podospora aff. communis PSN243]|uniref:HTH myb-type domain-containing protein n=1 Tax=Podospora aff. communis PSN243 TaxID=3040156 RepID=A0AAV9GGN9_9PEZI|nr:hypothetical protein QBC34DRAFT_426902 [Podospora aff. communis PSN243]
MCVIVYSRCPGCFGLIQIATQVNTRVYRAKHGQGPLKMRHYLPCPDFEEVGVENLVSPLRFEGELPVIKEHNCLALYGDAKIIKDWGDGDKIELYNHLRARREQLLRDAWEIDEAEDPDNDGGEDVAEDEEMASDEEEADINGPDGSANEIDHQDEDSGAKVQESDLAPAKSVRVDHWTADEDEKLWELASLVPKLGFSETSQRMGDRTENACRSRMSRLRALKRTANK